MGLPFKVAIIWPCDNSRPHRSHRRTCRCGTAIRRATGRSMPPRPPSRAAPGTSARPPAMTRSSAISRSSGPVRRRCFRVNPRSARVDGPNETTSATRLIGMNGGRLSEPAWADPRILTSWAVCADGRWASVTSDSPAGAQRPALHDRPEKGVDRVRVARGAAWPGPRPERARCSGKRGSAISACRSAESAWWDPVTSRASTLTGTSRRRCSTLRLTPRWRG